MLLRLHDSTGKTSALTKKLNMLLILGAIFLLLMSFHELDLAFNVKNNDCIDTNLFGITKDSVTMHLQGLTELVLAVMFLIASLLLF